jgi:NAD(P)-dependent dehydrogenase (short-subunit alcohol dehydrogenase family)
MINCFSSYCQTSQVRFNNNNIYKGFETAKDLAHRGGTIVLACRDLNKANIALDKIVAETSNKNSFVEQLDLASMESIIEFVNQFQAKFDRLDILINNAGMYVLNL